MTAHAFEGGFADPATESAHAFRAIMTAMACPGQIETIAGVGGPRPLSPAAATVLLTLCDATTRLYLTPAYDVAPVRSWIAFHTGASFCEADAPETADFALGSWPALIPINRFAHGTPEYPDRSATLIVECADLTAKGADLTGPGIEARREFSLPEITAFQDNAARYPMGLDFIFTAGDRIAALPRSTKVR